MSGTDSFTASDFYGSPATEATADDVATKVAEVSTDDASPDPVGQAEVTDSQPAKNYFDPSEHADRVVKIKIDGEEVEVPLSEALSGYQRQSDYTRKTQELAAERDRLAFWQQVDAAAQVDPKRTLEFLQSQLLQGGAEPTAPGPDVQIDPTQAALAALQQQMAPALEYVQLAQAEQHLNQVCAQLEAKYSGDFNTEKVLTEAMNRGIFDAGLIESVFKDMEFERYRAFNAAQGQVSAQTAAETAQRQAAAQQAAAVTSAGASASRGANAGTAPSQPRTVAEAWAQAKAEHGL